MGFAPTTTSLATRGSTTELRSLLVSYPRLCEVGLGTFHFVPGWPPAYNTNKLVSYSCESLKLKISGASDGIRTHDNLVGNEGLYC